WRVRWPSKEQRRSAPATKSLPPISFFVPGAAPAPKATRPAPVIGSAARPPSRLAAPSVVMRPTYCVASVRTTTDRFVGRRRRLMAPSVTASAHTALPELRADQPYRHPREEAALTRN